MKFALRWITLLSLGLLLIGPVHAQENLLGGGGWKTSSAGIVSVYPGMTSLYHNTSSLLDKSQTMGMDLSYEGRFGLSDLTTLSAGAYFKRASNLFALSAVRFGNSDYAEQSLRLSYARKLASGLSLSGSFVSNQYLIAESDRSYAFQIDLGLFARVNEGLALGAFAKNPLVSALDENSNLPVVLSFGCLFEPSTKVRCMGELEKTSDRPITVKVAVEYLPVQDIRIRMGGDLSRNTFGIGFVYTFQSVGLVPAMSINPLLGKSPSLSLFFEK